MSESRRSFFVYVLKSEMTGSRFVGSSDDVDRYIERLKAGHFGSTKYGRPWRFVYIEAFATRSQAIRHQLLLNTAQGRAWLDARFG